MEDFLSNYGLYQQYILTEEYTIGNQDYTGPCDFIGQTFDYQCERENKKTTFELDIDNSEYLGYLDGDKIPDENFIDEKLNFTFKAIGKCKSCNNNYIYFLLNVFSDKPIANIKDNINNIAFHKNNNVYHPGTNIIIQKVGSNPEIKIVPDKIVSKYFNREINNLYFKGLKSLNQNYGIGSFAYFRRIIETELINIINDIKSLPDSHSSEIEKLLIKHNENPKISTIYDNIFEYLPNSLKALGDNPIKLLYNQTSEGLHSFSETECLEKAKIIVALLEFVIKKINEERSELKNIKNLIKGLK